MAAANNDVGFISRSFCEQVAHTREKCNADAKREFRVKSLYSQSAGWKQQDGLFTESGKFPKSRDPWRNDGSSFACVIREVEDVGLAETTWNS